MKRGWIVVVLMALVVLSSVPVSAQADEDTLVLFYGLGCPHCAAEHAFLEDLQREFPQLEIEEYEVWYDEANRARLIATMDQLGEEAGSVPVTIYQGQVFVGYSDALGEHLRALAAARYASQPGPVPSEPDATVSIPLLGTFDVEHQPLVISTLAIGFVDGFNPCSLWVLSILLALVLRTGSRRRVFAVGSTFLLVTAALYGLYIAGLYGALSFVAYSSWVRLAMALVALTFGLVNLRDYFGGRGFSLSIPEGKKPGIYQRMRSVARIDNTLPSALMGTTVLAVGVSIIETPCTAGYPLLWADLLAEQGVAIGTAGLLFALYMVVFLLDEFLIFGVAVVAMRATKIEERHGRFLKLASGTVMVTLAGVLVLVPETMESVAGAIGVFVAAGVLGALIAVAARVRRSFRQLPSNSQRPKSRHPSPR